MNYFFMALGERSIFVRMCLRYRTRQPMHIIIDRIVEIRVVILAGYSYSYLRRIRKRTAIMMAIALQAKNSTNQYFQKR